MKPYSISCVYRGDNGQKCAVGCLIPDEIYDTNMEGHGVGEILHTYTLPDLVGNYALLSRLQNLHDRSHSTSTYSKLPFTNEYLNEGFTKIAIEFSLQYTPR